MSKVPWEMELYGKRKFSLRFPYNPTILNAVKTLPGAVWNPKIKRWTFPLNLQTVNKVTDTGNFHNVNFIVDDKMKRWVRKERKKIANIISPDAIQKYGDEKLDAMMPVLMNSNPDTWRALRSRPFQMLGAQFIADNGQCVLMADQPGMGKTVQTLSAIIELGITGPILVVAPRTAASVTWPAEIRRWVGPDESVTIINAELKPGERGEAIKRAVAATQSSPNSREWIICGPNYLRAEAALSDDGSRYKLDEKGRKQFWTVREGRAELFGIKWSAIIVDESHQTLAGATGNKKKQSAQRLGLGLLQVSGNGLRAALSGTPFRGKPQNLWGELNWLNPDQYTSYWQWINLHFGTESGSYGIEIGENIIDEKAFYEELKPMMIRRTKTEVMGDLPEKAYGGEPLDPADKNSPIAVWLEMTKAQKKQYETMNKKALLQISDRPDMPVNGILAEITRLKQIANSRIDIKEPDNNGIEIIDATTDSNKIDWILEFVEERKGQNKVIIASQFTKFIYAISAALTRQGHRHYLLTGKQNDAERKLAQEGFQSDGGAEIFLLNTKAGGVSLTLDQADDVVICDSTYNPDDQEQVEDRAHRVSRIHNVTVWYLCSRDTIDETIMEIVSRREFATKSAIDGQRGVTFTKKLVSEIKQKAAGK